MKKFVENLAALVKVKTVVTLVVIIVFAVLALRGDITPNNVMIIVSSVIAFYFGTQHEKNTKTNTEQITSSCPFMIGESFEGDTEGETVNDIEGIEVE